MNEKKEKEENPSRKRNVKGTEKKGDETIMEKSRRKKISYCLTRKWSQVIRRERQREKNEEKEERKVRDDSL